MFGLHYVFAIAFALCISAGAGLGGFFYHRRPRTPSSSDQDEAEFEAIATSSARHSVQDLDRLFGEIGSVLQDIHRAAALGLHPDGAQLTNAILSGARCERAFRNVRTSMRENKSSSSAQVTLD